VDKSGQTDYLEIVRSLICVPGIYIPSSKSNMENWPVVACDQFTSEPEYWQNVRKRVGDDPSSYNIILPEIYLEHPGEFPVEKRIININSKMNEYLDNLVLESVGECFCLIDRQTPVSQSRRGLLISIDLEKYEFKPDSDSLIRATEGTVLDRIPPRMRIRKDAALEIPHVQLLMDDPGDTVIGPLFEKAKSGGYNLLYDLKLHEDGGHVKGYQIPGDSQDIDGIYLALSKLHSLIKYNLLFAVGDGNHSLATAKSHWDSIKQNLPDNHPARYALVELINIYDDGIKFEPIHRVLFGTSFDKFIRLSASLIPEVEVIISEKMSVNNAIVMAGAIDSRVLPVPVFSKDEAVVFTFPKSSEILPVTVIQKLIDEYINKYPNAKVDYIHGESTVRNLAEKNIGILLPAISKETFFRTIAGKGVFPRKTFSIGEAFEKRYYIECKKIR